MASPIVSVVIVTLLLIKERYLRCLVGHLVALAPLLSVARGPWKSRGASDVQKLGWSFKYLNDSKIETEII